MKNIKCECGHINPEGTILCEACGKPIERNQHLDGNDKTKLLNMRYEGTARRSQTYTRSMIDKTWSFFSSVKVGIWLIIIALIASGLGTIFPQEMYIPEDAVSRDPAIFYEAQYGLFGKMYYQLGLHNLYTSWWYLLIIALIGVSLVICSLDRFVPLYRALNMQKAKRHEKFVNRQRLYSETKDVSQEDMATLKKHLKKSRYNIREEDGHILAEKGRFSRWGPYVNHIGLIIILLAAVLRMTPMYLDEYVWVREGEKTLIPGTDREFYIENKNFHLETYDESDERFKEAVEQSGEPIAKNYQTDAVIYQSKGETVVGEEPELEKYTEAEIRMNHPLKFASYTLYQAGFQLNEFNSMSFELTDQNDPEGEAIGKFQVDDLMAPDSVYELDNGYTVEVSEYWPDYYLDDADGPRSETRYPRNPAFVFFVHAPDLDEPEVNFIGIGRNISTEDTQYEIGITDFQTHSVSGLTVRRDYTLPFFALGALIFMIGVIQGMYWQHRRIWIHPKDNELLVAAHTNKNWFGLKKDIEKVMKDTNVTMVEDYQELDE